MAEKVHLRPKKIHPVIRVLSGRRSNIVKSDLENRKSRTKLMEEGIYKLENIFGTDLENLSNESNKMPRFLVALITKIAGLMSTEGVYRINGNAAAVQKLR